MASFFTPGLTVASGVSLNQLVIPGCPLQSVCTRSGAISFSEGTSSRGEQCVPRSVSVAFACKS